VNLLALCQNSLGDWKAAVRAYGRALILQQQQGDADGGRSTKEILVNRAQAKRDGGAAEDALADFGLAIEVDPEVNGYGCGVAVVRGGGGESESDMRVRVMNRRKTSVRTRRERE
jgi:tetratricopeptide (TPR) repeat protein